MTAYYNEFDPFAAEWLRNLIKQGLIADGIVDERSITSVEAADLGDFTQCHFFAGIGGWSHALRLAGWPDDRPVWTGSCPCQPFSAAGKRGGTDDERHLWPELRRLVAECRPSIFFGEQVASKDGRAWFNDVRLDLEALGYGVGAADLCAAGLGAPHIRQRLWIVGERAADTDGAVAQLTARSRSRPNETEGAGALGQPDGRGDTGRVEHGLVEGLEGQRRGHSSAGGRPVAAGSASETGEPRRLADAEHDDGREDQPRRRQEGRAADGRDGSIGRVADSASGGCGERGDALVARESGHADGGVDDRRPRPTDGFWRDADWLHCRDGKWRPVEPGTFPLAHGLPNRVGRLRGYGNAIVPQVAAEVIAAWMECRP